MTCMAKKCIFFSCLLALTINSNFMAKIESDLFTRMVKVKPYTALSCDNHELNWLT